MSEDFKKETEALVQQIMRELDRCTCNGYLGPCGCTDAIRWNVEDFVEKHFAKS